MTIHDIAAGLDITAATVSRALNDNPRISLSTRDKVKKMAKALNYQPNTLAASLRNGKSSTIGIIVPTINRSFFSNVVKGVEEIAHGHGYRVIISQSHDSQENEAAIVNTLANARVEGIITSLGRNTVDFTHYTDLVKEEIPLIQFDRANEEIIANQVTIDDYTGAYLATQHLIDNGYCKIAHFTSSKELNIYRDRLRGYNQALRDNKISLSEDLICNSDLELLDGRQCAQDLFEKNIPFEAIFSASDYAAAGAMRVIKEKGLKIPKDIGIVGFGDEPFTSFTDPSLTTVCQFPLEMGQMAAEQLFNTINLSGKKAGPGKKVINPKLIIRASSKRG